MNFPIWRVVARGPFTDEARQAILEAGIIVAAGHEGPGLVSTSFAIGAPRAEDAVLLVKRALDGHALFVVEDDVKLLNPDDAPLDEGS